MKKLLLQKERDDITALYKSVPPQQSKQSDTSSFVSASTTQELSSHGNLSLDRVSAVQSAHVHPVATECEFFHGRNSPDFTTRLQRMPASTSNVGMVQSTGNHVTFAFSRQLSDSAASLAGAYHSFRSSDDVTSALRRSLDSTFPPAAKSTDLLPQYLTQNSFSNANGPCVGSAPASSSVSNTLKILPESANDSANVHGHLEIKAAFADRGLSDEAFHNYGNISGEMSVDDGDLGHSRSESFKPRRSVSSGRGSRYHAGRLSRNGGDRQAARLPRSSTEGHGVRSIIRCPICSKLFNNSSALAKHKLTHSDERKYTCTKCSKAFKRQDHLNGHMMTHSSKKPFECKFIGCAKSYCDARSLRRHLENHHQDYISTTAAFDSANCLVDGGSVELSATASDTSLHGIPADTQFNASSVWTTGYNPLDEPKPVKCHVCDRGFKNIAALNGHMRLHGGYIRKDPGEFVMNEDRSHQGSENDISPEVEHGPPLNSETGCEIQGKSTVENSPTAATQSRMQSKLSEMHNDLIRHSPYGLWMSSGTSVMGNVDWRNQGPSHESSVHWSSLLSVSSVGKNVPFDCLQKIPSCRTTAPAICHSSDIERIANSESGLVTKWNDAVDFTAGREHEQFNLWKMASLIRGISPSEQDKRKGSDIRDELFHHRSLMDDGKVAERVWTFGRNDHHMKMKSMSASSALSYPPIFGSETANSDLDATSKFHIRGGKREGQLIDNPAVIISSTEQTTGDQPTFVTTLKAFEQLPANKYADVFARMKLNHPQSSIQLSGSPENQGCVRTQNAESRELSSSHPDTVSEVNTYHAVNSTCDKQVLIGSKSLQLEDITSSCVAASQLAALPAESGASGLADLDATRDKAPASSMPVSESSNNGSSLYRRRVKNLLLKQGNSVSDGCDAELPKSPRIQNHYGSAFEHNDSSIEVAVPDNGCGNFHKEKCRQEHTDEVNSGTHVALCHSASESASKNVDVGSTGCRSGHPHEQEKISKCGMSGMSGGVVNFATVSAEALDKDYCPHVNDIDCSYTGQLTKDGVRYGCVEKALHVNAGASCCHSGCGTVSHSACQCCTDVSACHLSPSCHLPIKVSPAAVCDLAAKCCVARHLASLPTPTRACAAALCQLSRSGIPSHADSSKGTDPSPGCQLGRSPKSGSQCTTPCHPALVKCACVGDSYLTPFHQSGCPYTVKKSSVRGCSARIFREDHVQQIGDTQPHTPCMAHTPYTPRETHTAREPDTPHDSDGVREPCTPQSLCSYRARKYPCTPTAACYFQFPPVHASQLDCSSGGLCQSPCISYARRLPSCHTPCMSPLNLTIGQPCITRACTPQCCFQHQKLTSCVTRHRHSCGCVSDKDEVQSRSGTLDGGDNHKLRGEEEAVQSTCKAERTRTPATVAEPDSTMSNEVGDNVMRADVEPGDSRAMVDERSAVKLTEHRILNDDVNDVMSSDCDATDSRCRNFTDRLGLERLLGFETMKNGNGSEIATELDTKRAENTRYIEPSSSELTKICQKKADSVLGRSSGLTSRKRHRAVDAEVDIEQSGSRQYPSSAQSTDIRPQDGMRKKHRPDPLVLPPVSFERYGYPSWLRSPRIWNVSGPVPYTPPPMLSPARRAPGLYWVTARAQNQPLWSLFRQPSAFTYPELSEEMPPPTDIQPHINVGAQFQATLPPLNGSYRNAVKDDDRADLLWQPENATNPRNKDGSQYELQTGAAGLQEITALHLLNIWQNDSRKALMGTLPQVSGISSALQLHDPRANAEWNSAEIERFQQAVVEYDKDFMKISQHVGTKTVGQCVQYYYHWKKTKTDEYKRISVARRRRQEDELYQLRAASVSQWRHDTEHLADN